MRLPFSYKEEQFFRSVLVASFLGHLTFLGVGSFFAPAPQYAVEQAPSSMEVVIVNQPKPKEPKLKSKQVLSLQEPVQKASEVQQEKKKTPKRQDSNQNVVLPSAKGAVTETKPAYLRNPAPVYPELARTRGWEGTVVLKVLVSADGAVQEILVDSSSNYKILDDAALKTVQNWQFRPARVGHLAFSSWIKIPVRFTLIEENS